jgi:hypothetical protein
MGLWRRLRAPGGGGNINYECAGAVAGAAAGARRKSNRLQVSPVDAHIHSFYIHN